MKKHLIAAAVAAAVAVPAMAQVTVSGRIDAGYSMTSATTAAGVKTDTDLITTGVFTTQRLTFTGSEDLGGGLKASFVMESAIAQNTALTFGDRAFNATLSGGFGSLLIGRIDSMTKSVYDAFDAGYSNNLVGSVDALDAATNTTSRRDVTIRYTTPSFSGLTASIGLMKNSVDASTASNTVEDNTGEEFGLRYAAGPFNAALAYRNVDIDTAAVAAVPSTCNATGTFTSPNGCTLGSAAVAATKTENKDLGLGLSYNFGPVVAFGQYFDNESTNKVSGVKTDEKFYAIGVRVPLGATTVFASYVDGESKTGATKFDREGYQLGVKYDFSKRTYAYLAYGDQESDAANNTKAKSDQTAFGIVHLF